MSEVFSGDCREVLSKLPEGSVHCVVTSPPYYGLRDYGVAPSAWDGDADCEHDWGDTGKPFHKGQVEQTKWKSASGAGVAGNAPSGRFCGECGAWQGCLGLEPTPDLYVAHLVECFGAVWRVLRDDGVLWLNLGDTFCSTAPGTVGDPINQRGVVAGVSDRRAKASKKYRPATPPGLKPKDLMGIPWRVALALQADGWWLRSEVIWAKGVSGQKELAGQVAEAMRGRDCTDGQVRGVLEDLGLYVGNCMPESVKDRPTRSHEHLFLLTKSKRYHYDVDAVREASDSDYSRDAVRLAGKAGGPRPQGDNFSKQSRKDGRATPRTRAERARLLNPRGRNRRDVWTIATRPCLWEYCLNCDTLYEGKERSQIDKRDGKRFCPECGLSDHWVDHFAQFPPDLVEPCMLAGTSAAGCCAECGTPHRRRLERTGEVDASAKGSRFDQGRTGARDGGGRTQAGERRLMRHVGWEPSCRCGVAAAPCVVLDPFCGAGNAGLVAVRNGLRFIGVDVNPEYAAVAEARLRREGMTDD